MNTESRNSTPLSAVYDQSFYDSQVDGSLASARIYLRHLFDFFKPVSVVDIGCGRGAWLSTCHELGSTHIVGYDGLWNSQSQMIDGAIQFNAVDLNAPIDAGQQFDLAISLEVAEHLLPDSALQFVTSLSRISDVILFGAAIPGQGGTNHLNEQYQSYWGRLFLERNYHIFDVFRPPFWLDRRIDPWYRQNTFLYVKNGHVLHTELKTRGIQEIINLPFMDCVHPWLLEVKLSQLSANLQENMRFKQHLQDLIPSFMRGIKSRLAP